MVPKVPATENKPIFTTGVVTLASIEVASRAPATCASFELGACFVPAFLELFAYFLDSSCCFFYLFLDESEEVH